MTYELVSNHPPSHTVGHYETLDEARRVIRQREKYGLRHWSIWRCENGERVEHMESSDSRFVAEIDGRAA